MGEVRAYPNGTFCWIDLATPDVAGARAFYTAMFGWETVDLPGGDAGSFTVCRLEGKDVAALHEQGEDGTAEWGSYISVDDVDAATSAARNLGAHVQTEPFDVTDAGRTSVIRDPTGAVLSLWQPRGRIGARLVNEVGAWGWNELVTPAPDAAKAFYGELFGWQAEDVPAAIPRASFSLGRLLIGGVHASTEQEGDASRWTISFGVADADESTSRAERLGGGIVLPPMDITIGRFAIVSDPAGATFTLAAVPGGSLRGVDGS